MTSTKIPTTIAIDGPAASGKSTIGKRIADQLGYLFFDTGVMYRAVTWAALDSGQPIQDEVAITNLAENTQIDVRPASQADGRTCDILVDNQDITWKIRQPAVDANVSAVSAYAGVRRALTDQQRRIGLRGRVVMVGRDIGTIVMPEAELKIYLDASAEERARRRHLENLQRGEISDQKDILQAVLKRDETDSRRAIAPLRPAADAILINSDQMDVEEVIQFIMKLIDQEPQE